MATIRRSEPRIFPSSGFNIIDSTLKIEEETLPGYLAERYYPVHIGEVFNSRYQILTKLGFGSASTVWLCRDLNQNCYQVLKVHVRSWQPAQEMEVLKHLRSLPGEQHPGEDFVRFPLDIFEVTGPHGVHPCLLYKPAGIDIYDLASCLEAEALPEALLRPAIRYVLIALDYLHQGNIIHTDVQPNNLLLGMEDESILTKLEEDEISNPSPRKQLPDRTIYATRGMPVSTGQPALSDLGEARIAESGNQVGPVMPSVYRAPEVMLGMEWDNKIDIWAVGQMTWTLFEAGHLFKTHHLDTELDHAKRYAEMVALLGPPPAEFLERSKDSFKFWDENGNWRGLAEVPAQTLEARELRLEGDNKISFLEFLRKTMQWRPEDRPTAEELLFDKWVRGDTY
ncbi:kinase-like protein [Aspergillus granulosus]|uniref:non-specific serine/threonine protein kinase n=1 Tax=Aspergillus granulosus TaxID=176169 RepID=A0ABR4H6Q8_9EURO